QPLRLPSSAPAGVGAARVKGVRERAKAPPRGAKPRRTAFVPLRERRRWPKLVKRRLQQRVAGGGLGAVGVDDDAFAADDAVGAAAAIDALHLADGHAVALADGGQGVAVARGDDQPLAAVLT